MKMILNKEKKYKNYMSLNLNDYFTINGKKNKVMIRIYNEEMINNVLMKGINARLKKILELMLIAEDDTDPSNGLLLCLNETEKFKKELINKNRKFLQKEKFEFLTKKIALLKKEIENKIFIVRMNQMSNMPYVEREEKSSSKGR